MTVLWAFPGGIVDFYDFQYKLRVDNWGDPGTMVRRVDGSRENITLINLQPESTYDVRIRTRNANGFSEFSDASFTTLRKWAFSVYTCSIVYMFKVAIYLLVLVHTHTSQPPHQTWKSPLPLGAQQWRRVHQSPSSA